MSQKPAANKVVSSATLPRSRTSSSLSNTVRVSTTRSNLAGQRRTVNMGAINMRQK